MDNKTLANIFFNMCLDFGDIGSFENLQEVDDSIDYLASGFTGLNDAARYTLEIIAEQNIELLNNHLQFFGGDDF